MVNGLPISPSAPARVFGDILAPSRVFGAPERSLSWWPRFRRYALPLKTRPHEI